MSTVWKVIAALLLTLPVGAYVAGTLVASQADVPIERAPIVIRDSATGSAGPSTPAETMSPRPTARPTDKENDGPDGKGDDDDDSSGPGGGDDDGDDDVRVVRPSPDDIEDDDDDAGRDDDDGGDDDGDDDD